MTNEIDVCVLMSTYNGEKYLDEQIDSVLSQTGVNVNLIVRDDGSSDSTLLILNEYAMKKKLSWYSGDNLGPANSFFDLLKKAPDTPFYALSDQDDVWLEDKLISAIKKMDKHDKPELFFSSKIFVDKDLSPIQVNDSLHKNFGLPIVVSKSFASGCTMVMTSSFRNIINDFTPNYVQMHDSWLMIIAQLFGEIKYDSSGKMLYRIHDDNTVGIASERNWVLKKLLDFPSRFSRNRSRVIVEVMRGYSEKLSYENRIFLTEIINSQNSFTSKMKLFFLRNRYSFSIIDDIFIRFLLLFGLF